ncbi:hypothetical protein ACIQM4_28885 [Streptomyces sp. NPDC091272]
MSDISVEQIGEDTLRVRVGEREFEVGAPTARAAGASSPTVT